MSTTTLSPTANDVRAWAARKGIEVASRGRLDSEVIEAFNKGRKVPYVSTMKQPQPLMRIVGKRADSSGRNRTVIYKITAADLRTWAKENGFANVPPTGRVPAEIVEAFALREAKV